MRVVVRLQRGGATIGGMGNPPPAPLVSGPVLDTKFFLPRWRPGLVPRARLVARLERGAASKLTLVSAPPGFGKTTLLAEWLAAARADERSVAWLSLDPSDNHPITFWTYVITALQRVQPELGTRAIALLQSPHPPPIETLLATVLNEFATVPHDLMLVLDDYHVIEAAPIHDGMAFLLDHLPPRLHLIIVSRADPVLPLARLRARGELVEVRAADLRFTEDEAAAFLTAAMGLALTASQVAALEDRTEGWIAALQLAALSLQGRDDVAAFIAGFAGNDRYIVDYLVEEVLRRQPDQVRGFLLQTAILDRLCAPLCDAVTGRDHGKAMLATLERGNLFLVSLDDTRRWYRYHHLFADVLQSHLAEEQPDQVSVLHGRASAWYERDGQPFRAIRHALAAGDPARAAGLVEREAQAAMRGHQPHRLIDWLRPIPDAIIRSMPVLSTYYAMALQGVGDMEASASRLRDAEWWLDDTTDLPERAAAPAAEMVVVDEDGFRSLPSRIALARGYLASAAGDAAGTLRAGRRALELLPADEHHWHGTAAALVGLAHWRRGDLAAAVPLHADAVARFERAGDSGLALSSAYHQADLLKACGRLSEAEQRYERSLRFAMEHGDPTMSGAANLHFGFSELWCERADLERAHHHLQHGEDLGKATTDPRLRYRRLLAWARLRQTRGDLEGALTALDEAEQLFVRGAVPVVRPIEAWKVRLWLAQGRPAEALEWTRARGLSVHDDPDYAREYEHITLARVLLARDAREHEHRCDEEMGRLLGRLLEAAEGGGRTGSVIEILILQALAHALYGDVAGALAPLARALTLGEPEGYVRIFADEGPPMRDLLRHAVTAGIGGAYARRLLTAFERPADPVTASSRARVDGLAEPLTAREIEILRLIAAGMQNQEIADHLVISLATVKRHIANVYGKLGAGHRTAAVARATELRLL
jgi:LuxR family maltose regulon positive regulatory protein